MNKIGIASVAVVVLTGSAIAGFDRDSLMNNVIDGQATKIGTFSRSQLDAMRGTAVKSTAMYSSNWATDSNGATYTTGNVSANVNASAAGQGNWYAYSTTTSSGNNAAVSNYKISAGRPGATTTPGLQITGSNTSAGTRYMYQDVSSQWAARNAGDNIAWLDYSQYCASASSTSGNRAGTVFFDATGTKFLTGMAIEMGTLGTSTTQRSVYGYANYASGTTIGNYRFKLSDQVLSDGSTSQKAVSGGYTQFSTSWNQATGEVFWYYSVDGGANYTGFYVNGAGAGSQLLEMDFYTSTTSGSTVGVTVNYGDLAIYATPAPGAAALVGLAGLMARRRRA